MAIQKVEWTPTALADLKGIEDYISLDQPRNAENFVDELVDSTEKLIQFPRLGAVFTYKRQNLRRWSFRGYKVVYRVTEMSVRILAVIHPSRDIYAALYARKLK